MDTHHDAFERTCLLAEDFATREASDAGYDPITASRVVIATMDFLRERLGPDASFAQLDPAAMIAHVVRTLPGQVGAFAEVLRDFYAWLKDASEVEPARCQYLACYFDTLLELHGAGPTGILPTRASRRATATLARRITEARIRSDERDRKKSAA